MARIRTVKPEFWTSEQILELSTTARLLFIGMWNFCDDGGVHVASPKRLKAEVFPADDFTTEDVRRLIGELVANDLVIEFSAGGRRFWKVTGWKHQKIDRPNPKYPQPETNPSPPRSSNARRSVTAGRESRGVEGSGAGSPEPDAGPDSEQDTARAADGSGEIAAAPPDVTEPIGEATPSPVPASPSPAVEVIAAFDAERARVFGAAQARPHPNATDLGVAKAMLDGGADLETCRFVFGATFERQKAAGQRPAAMLRYMRDPVADAVADGVPDARSDPLAIPEKYRRVATGPRFRNPSDIQRQARVESYRRAVAEGRAPFWLDDEWGPPPDAEAAG